LTVPDTQCCRAAYNASIVPFYEGGRRTRVVARIMKNYFVWAMLLMDVYAIVCICLLLLLFAGTEMPPFTFTQMRS
jgi:hypothetical protein